MWSHYASTVPAPLVTSPLQNSVQSLTLVMCAVYVWRYPKCLDRTVQLVTSVLCTRDCTALVGQFALCRSDDSLSHRSNQMEHHLLCWWHTGKNLVQETCTSFSYKTFASSFDASFLYFWNLFPRWHHNNNNLTALHKTAFTLPLTSPLQVLCFGVLCKWAYKL